MSDSLSKVEKTVVLTFLKNNGVSIEVKTPMSICNAIFKDLNNNELLIEFETIPQDIKEYKLQCEVFFYYQNNYHTFKTYVLKYQGRNAVLKNPEFVAKNLKREHNRVNVGGRFSVDLLIPSDLLPLDYPLSEEFYNPLKPPVNADFSDIKIVDILSRFNKKIETMVSTNKIQMLRNYKPKNFLEKLAITKGKIVFVPNTSSDLIIKTGDGIPDNICKKSDWIDFEVELNGTQDTYLNKAISSYMMELKDNNFISFAIVPIIYRNYVVGLITLANDFKKDKPIEYSVIGYADQFSKILTYALKSTGYFKAEIGEKDKFSVKMFDISPGGVSVLTEGDSLEEKIDVDDNVEMILQFNSRSIRVLTKFIRKQEKLLNFIYGFKFIDISIDDFNYLENSFKN